MAGIMTENLSDDIRKLDELRRKIDEVKKSLKGINIKVDLDIAEGLQAQLKSLTTEYNALLTTVAQGEAKMLATVARIRETTQKVIDAQNAVIGSNPSAPTTPNGTTTPTTPTGTQNVGQQVQGAEAVEQANVQLAKSYQELERELDAIGGSMEANALLYVNESNAVNIAKENLKKLNKQIKEQGYATEKQTRLQTHYTLQLEEHKKAQAQARIELGNQIKLNQAAGGSMAEMSQQLSRMRIVYRNLTETERNSDFGKGLLASIQMTDAEIKKLDATIGNHQRNVGNYASGWNGLNVSIQQMVRELPSLSMGFNTFFLAISNNLPIFVDELKKASAEGEAMKAKGEKATPVWKQLIGGFLNWQTALVIGITLLSQYGDEIIDWVKGMLNGGEAAKKAAEEQKKLNEAIKDYSKEWTTEAGKLRSSYELLRSEWLALSTEQEKRKWIKDNATEIGNLGVAFDNLAEAEDFFEKNTKNVIRAFELRAQAAAAAEQMQKAWERYYAEFDAAGQKKYADARTMIGNTIYIGDMVKYGLAEARRNERGGIEYYSTTTGVKLQHGGRELTRDMADAINRYRNNQLNAEIAEERTAAAERLREASEKWSKIALSSETESEKLLKKYEPKKKGSKGGGGKKWDAKAAAYEQAQIMRQYTESVIAIYQEAQLNITERRIAAISEGTDREIAEIRNGAALELAAIDEQIKQLAKARAEREKNVWLKGAKGRTEAQYAETEAGKRTEADWIAIVQKENPHIIAAFNTQKALIKDERDKQIKEISLAELVSEQETLREWAKHFGTREQQRQAIWEEWQAKIAKAKTEAQKKLLRSQMEAELNAFDFETFKKNINWEEAFTNLEAKSKQALTTLREQLSQYLALNKDLKPDQIKAVTDALKQLDGAIANKSSIKDVIGLFKGGFKGKGGNILTGGYMDEGQAAGINAVAGKFQNASAAIKATLDLTDTLGIELGKNLREGLEETTEGMDKFAQGLKTSITNPIAGVMQVVDGLVTSLRGMAKTIVGIFGIETANSRYDDLVKQYEGLLKLWDELISKKKEYITESYGEEIRRAAKEAEEVANNMIEANRELGKAYLKTKDFFLGKNKGRQQLSDMEDSWIEAAANAAGMETFSFSGLFDLTGEQLQRVKEEAQEFWASMDDETTKYLEAIIDGGEELKKIHEAELEQITGMNFDSVLDNFKSLLGDMTNSWQQFSDTASQYFQQSVIGNLVGEKFRAELEQWYEAFGSAGTDGSFTQAERDSLLSQYDSIAERAIAERKRLAEMFGWSATESSESGTSGRGFAEMNQESADELNGRFASLQISNQGILNEAVQHTQALWATAAWSEEIAKHQQNMYSVADETRTILANSYLELKGISENTRKGTQYLQAMQADMAAVRHNTKNL